MRSALPFSAPFVFPLSAHSPAAADADSEFPASLECPRRGPHNARTFRPRRSRCPTIPRTHSCPRHPTAARCDFPRLGPAARPTPVPDSRRCARSGSRASAPRSAAGAQSGFPSPGRCTRRGRTSREPPRRAPTRCPWPGARARGGQGSGRQRSTDRFPPRRGPALARFSSRDSTASRRCRSPCTDHRRRPGHLFRHCPYPRRPSFSAHSSTAISAGSAPSKLGGERRRLSRNRSRLCRASPSALAAAPSLPPARPAPQRPCAFAPREDAPPLAVRPPPAEAACALPRSSPQQIVPDCI
mmetsp:Transcript_13289/g.32519  ORF Transcript_13289/g.32519 Transcript_13289/m.32519 type:complete len:299 (+) Transcript_13289:3743-4639(+)